MLEAYGMVDARPAKTPAEAGPVQIEEDEIFDHPIPVCHGISSLSYSRCTWPHIAHAVMILTQSISKPGPRAMVKMKRVLRYFKGTTSIGLTYSEDAENGGELTAYVDEDHDDDMDKGYSGQESLCA